MTLKRNILIFNLLLFPVIVFSQSVQDTLQVRKISWESRIISDGVVVRSANTNLFNSVQAIYLVDIDTARADFEFGVAIPDSVMTTSVYAGELGVLAAINGTFFNMKEGYNVHYVRMNDSVAAVTDEKEYGIRATGMFATTGELVDISFWNREIEEKNEISAEDVIVSGPLLIDENTDLTLQEINFNTHRHPRSLVGATDDGHILFVVVDGRQPGYAEGMSLFELRSLARMLGCTDALNLDGGGSSTLYVAGEGFSGVVNKPSGKAERPVPSILYVRTID